jgi:NAD/NADP transhydrogenase beta subunit
MENNILQLIYLLASITFIVGLKFLGNPATARKGNLIAAFGMGIAIFGTIFLYKNPENGAGLHNLIFIFAALAIGTVLGFIAAKKVQMTAMPEMVSLFNGMGGACAMLISIIEFRHLTSTNATGALLEGANFFSKIPIYNIQNITSASAFDENSDDNDNLNNVGNFNNIPLNSNEIIISLLEKINQLKDDDLYE